MKNMILTTFALFIIAMTMTYNPSEAQEMKNDCPNTKTLRLLFPQWQGGNNPPYVMGARLLAWLAPESDSPLVEVPVVAFDGNEAPLENGVVARTAIMKQLRSARNIIDAHEPDRLVVFGGDCLVSQAPFAYLNEKYDGKLGVLWIDAHPDVATPKEYQNSHAMVLGNLLGGGDPEMNREVKRHLNPRLVMYAGLEATSEQETEVIAKLGIRKAGYEQLKDDSKPVVDWLRENKIKHLAIHFDLDALDPKLFRSLLFSNPDSPGPIDAPSDRESPSGRMTLEQVARLIKDASAETEIVGLSIAEHLPWEAIKLQNFLDQMDILK